MSPYGATRPQSIKETVGFSSAAIAIEISQLLTHKQLETYGVHTQHCCNWCPGAKAPGHQYPQCWLNINFIPLIPCRDMLHLLWTSLENLNSFWKKKDQVANVLKRHRVSPAAVASKVSWGNGNSYGSRADKTLGISIGKTCLTIVRHYTYLCQYEILKFLPDNVDFCQMQGCRKPPTLRICPQAEIYDPH